MATSPYNDTVFVLDFLGRLIWGQKASVLDVGAGFGRWGFLCRCHMAGGVSLTVEPRQDLQIDAIEAWEQNVSPLYSCVYDHVFKGDAKKLIRQLDAYDVIIVSHCLEHFAKTDAWELVEEIKKHCRGVVLICLPFGDWPQEAVGGNPFEQHRSRWVPSDFAKGEWYVKCMSRGCLSSGVAIFPVSSEAKWQVRVMRSPVRRVFSGLAARWLSKPCRGGSGVIRCDS